ncbi:uncharacterized protein [Miscanthus floridulus]|uniref:uncharacterized protein n=1 Tax=Miscanthus floridulus TaxID=154761 RepID=UPI00345A33FE
MGAQREARIWMTEGVTRNPNSTTKPPPLATISSHDSHTSRTQHPAPLVTYGLTTAASSVGAPSLPQPSSLPPRPPTPAHSSEPEPPQPSSPPRRHSRRPCSRRPRARTEQLLLDLGIMNLFLRPIHMHRLSSRHQNCLKVFQQGERRARTQVEGGLGGVHDAGIWIMSPGSQHMTFCF